MATFLFVLVVVGQVDGPGDGKAKYTADTVSATEAGVKIPDDVFVSALDRNDVNAIFSLESRSGSAAYESPMEDGAAYSTELEYVRMATISGRQTYVGAVYKTIPRSSNIEEMYFFVALKPSKRGKNDYHGLFYSFDDKDYVGWLWLRKGK